MHFSHVFEIFVQQSVVVNISRQEKQFSFHAVFKRRQISLNSCGAIYRSRQFAQFFSNSIYRSRHITSISSSCIKTWQSASFGIRACSNSGLNPCTAPASHRNTAAEAAHAQEEGRDGHHLYLLLTIFLAGRRRPLQLPSYSIAPSMRM